MHRAITFLIIDLTKSPGNFLIREIQWLRITLNVIIINFKGEALRETIALPFKQTTENNNQGSIIDKIIENNNQGSIIDKISQNQSSIKGI